ncbi:DUF6458 family protein [Ornithinimicrobium sp. F0845]|uniref:DUF6458 family protein n=1 Tax=Ornithinimicrobium sp. F0845 TaxID=2926412 RepID=UPI001FF284D0|nr:DUF6458 family protein [Ornithinimicrobium sp. F0845]MCK0112115.1 DUF6458 family protein [Ornithinimicrobium sp. F0845]
MGIGIGITLLVVGAIISFTDLDESLVNTDLQVVGWILMAGGALALIMGLIQNAQRSNSSHTVIEERRGGPDVIERRDDRGV